MSQEMKNEDWLQFLKDLDNLERNCKIGFMGAYHVNIPHIANLTEHGAAEFYLKKEQLYQSTVYHLTGIQNYLFIWKNIKQKDHWKIDKKFNKKKYFGDVTFKSDNVEKIFKGSLDLI